MTQTPTITPARQAMLELIKSKSKSRSAGSIKSKISSTCSNTTSTCSNNSKSDDESTKKKKKRRYTWIKLTNMILKEN